MVAGNPGDALRIGREKLRQGQVTEAIELLRNVVQDEPNNAQAHAYLGVAHCQQKDFESAIRELTEARNLDTSSASIAFNLGVAHHSAGDMNLARACYQDAVRLDPTHEKAKAALERLGALQQAPAQPQVAAPPHYQQFTPVATPVGPAPGAATPDHPGEYAIRPGEAIRHGQSWEYASFWRRLIGYILDWLVLLIVGGIVAWPVFMGPLIKYIMEQQQIPQTPRVQTTIQLAQAQTPPSQSFPAIPQIPGFPGGRNVPLPPGLQAILPTLMVGVIKAQAITLLLGAIYATIMIGLIGQTLGMMAMGIRCIRPDGAGVGIPRAFLRWLIAKSVALLRVITGVTAGGLAAGPLWLLLSLGLLVAYLWMIWDQRNQTLFDKAVDSVVVRG